MKRKIVFILISVMLFAFFSGCEEETSSSHAPFPQVTSPVVQVPRKTPTPTGIGTFGIPVKETAKKDIVDFSSVFDTSDDGRYEANPYQLYAHNIYCDPYLGDTSGKYTGFSVDFRTDRMTEGTYWALCNFYMDLSPMQRDGYVVYGGDAYCGLQVANHHPQAIMSFWNVETPDGPLTPSLIYPEGEHESYFSDEGSGSHYFPRFFWEPDTWYRMYICCFDDDMGQTIVEMYLTNLDANVCTKVCAYNTHLHDSCFMGNMSQFLENFNEDTATQVRTFQLANFMVREKGSNKWTLLNQCTLSIDTQFGNKKGTCAFGATNNTVWGVTCGYGPDAADSMPYLSRSYKLKPTLKITN